MQEQVDSRAGRMGAAHSAAAPFNYSSFAALLLRKDRGMPEAVARDAFQRAIGSAPTFIVDAADFIVALAHSPSTRLVSDVSTGVSVLLHGDIYADGVDSGQAAQLLLTSIITLGIDRTAVAINGAYSALVISPDGIHIIIDRVGSRKIFFSEDSQGYWLTTTLGQHPRRKTDAAGVASLLINRYQYGGRTLYENVRTLERASIHTFNARGLTRQKYWQYDFSEAQPTVFTRNLADKKQELNELIRRAVKRRLPSSGDIWCSLSGGVDSRAIFGALLSCKDEWPGTLTALSYGLETDDDPKVARELCFKTGVSHKLVRFRGTLEHSIQDNGRHCEGLVYFYLHALSGIQQVARDFTADDVLFVGDECFGWHNNPGRSFDEVLTKGIGIRAPASVPAYYSYGQTPHTEIEAALQADIDALKQRHDTSTSWNDLEDILYLEERLCNMLLPWREYLNGRYIRVMNPLLDNEILEFLKTVPTAQRRDKGFFRAAVNDGFPDLFGIRLASAGGNNMRILESLFRNEDEALGHLVDGFDSALDEVIPPDIVMAGLIEMLDRLRLQGADLSPRVRNLAEWLRRKFTKARIYLAGPVRGAKSGSRHGLMSLSPLQMATLLQLRSMLKPRVQGAFTR